MAAGNLIVNTGTAQALLIDTAGTVDVGVVKIDTSAAGTYGSLWNGQVSVGTITNIPGGTLNSVTITGGTVSVNELSGTINLGTAVLNDGTIDVVKNAGTIQGGTINNLASGTINSATAVINSATISVLPNLPGGSIVITTGTINGGTLTNLISGTINAATAILNSGTINLGTVVGKDANAAAQVGNPLAFGGTDSGGTIRTAKIDSGGLQRMGLDSGTLTVLPNLPGGSVVVTAGTIVAGTLTNLVSGTINSATAVINSATISVLPNLPQGSINVTAGTITAGTLTNLISGTINSATVVLNSGTINVGTVVNNGGTIQLGTVVGKDANAVAQTGNPLAFGGTDSGGTVRTVLVTSAGALTVTGASAGTFVNLTTGTLNAGTINSSTVNAGTINTGTINTGTINLGTVVGKDANAAAQTGNPLAFGGTDSGGTIRTVKVDSGGLQRMGLDSGTLTVLPNLPGGSVVVTTGTIVAGTLTNLISGTINAATAVLNSGTINVGTVVIPSGTITTGTILSSGTSTGVGTITNLGSVTNVGQLYNAGTVQNQLAGTITTLQGGTIQLNPLVATNLVLHAGTSATTAIGTLVTAAAVGVGTAAYITHYSILAISGTPEVCLSFGSVVNGNQVIAHGLFPAGGGIVESVNYPHGYGTTNSPVTFQIISGSGTVAWDINYFLHT